MRTDLLYQDEIKGAVAKAYTELPAGAGDRAISRYYSTEERALIPARAIAWGLGVGNPVRHADIREGDTVLDVGSGGGIDSIYAAHRTGPSGHVIGVDLLEDMCARAAEHAAEAGVGDRCEFRVGEMERLPVDDASVDVVVSNGVINLSARKTRAMAEIVRVLKPGGRFCVSDLTVDEDLPTEILTSDAAWAG